jgi:hypothetical protein
MPPDYHGQRHTVTVGEPPIPAVPALSYMIVYGRGSFIALAASAFMAASESM